MSRHGKYSALNPNNPCFAPPTVETENAKLRAEVERLRALLDDNEIHKLAHEAATLRAVNDALKSKSVLGTAYASALEDLEAIRKLLAWFEAREPLLQHVLFRFGQMATLPTSTKADWAKWYSDNPKPEGGE